MRSIRVFAGSAVAIMAALVATASAQEYRSDPVDVKARAHQTIVGRVLKGLADFQTEKPKFDEYFQKYYFPAMTGTQPAQLAELGRLRADLFERYLRETSNEQIQDYLTDLTFRAMAPIVGSRGQPPYHPASRYNALLVIGLLDDQYGIDAGGGARPPKPLPAANDLLTAVLNAGNNNKAIPPALVVGALVGLERHARFRESLPADKITRMTDAVLKMATREEPLEGVNREVFRWIQLQAARTLARLGTVGPESKIHEALMNLVGDQKMGVDNRCSVAALLATITYEGATVDGATTADRMFSLARDLSADEKRRAEEFENIRTGNTLGAPRSAYGGMREAGGFGGYGGYGEQLKFERRQVLARATDLRSGLTTIRPVVPAEAQTKIDAIVPTIKAVIDAAIDEDTIDLAVTEKVRAMTDAIDRTLAVAEAPADEEALLEEALLEEQPAADQPAAAPAPDGAPPTDEPAEPAVAPPAEAAPTDEAPADTSTDASAAEGAAPPQ